MESEITLTDWHAAPGGSGGGSGRGGELVGARVWEHQAVQSEDRRKSDGNRRPAKNTVCMCVVVAKGV